MLIGAGGAQCRKMASRPSRNSTLGGEAIIICRSIVCHESRAEPKNWRFNVLKEGNHGEMAARNSLPAMLGIASGKSTPGLSAAHGKRRRARCDKRAGIREMKRCCRLISRLGGDEIAGDRRAARNPLATCGKWPWPPAQVSVLAPLPAAEKQWPDGVVFLRGRQKHQA